MGKQIISIEVSIGSYTHHLKYIHELQHILLELGIDEQIEYNGEKNKYVDNYRKLNLVKL